jgi:hypothetical protein
MIVCNAVSVAATHLLTDTSTELLQDLWPHQWHDPSFDSIEAIPKKIEASSDLKHINGVRFLWMQLQAGWFHPRRHPFQRFCRFFASGGSLPRLTTTQFPSASPPWSSFVAFRVTLIVIGYSHDHTSEVREAVSNWGSHSGSAVEMASPVRYKINPSYGSIQDCEIKRLATFARLAATSTKASRLEWLPESRSARACFLG